MSLKKTNSKTAWIKTLFYIELLILLLAILYAFTVSTFHLPEAFGKASFFSYRLPISNGFILYFLIGVGGVFAIFRQFILKKKYFADTFDYLFLALLFFCVISLGWCKIYASNFITTTNLTVTYLFYFILFNLIKEQPKLTLTCIRYCIYMLAFVFSLHFFISNIHILFEFSNSNNSYQSIINKTKSYVGNKNQTACFLGLLIPILFIIRTEKEKLPIFILIGILFFHLLIMGSRNVYIAMLLFTAVYFILMIKNFRQLIKPAVGVLFIFVVFALLINAGNFLEHLGSDTFSSRVNTWTDTWNMAMDNLLIGNGAGQWDTYKWNYNNWYIHPHNDYFRNLAELGIIGFVLYYSIFGLIFLRCIQLLSFDNNRKFAAFALAALTAYLSMSFFDEMKLKLNYNLLLSLIFALVNYNWINLKIPQSNNSKYHTVYKFMLLIMAIFLLLYPIKISKELNNYSNFLAANKSKDYNKCFEALIKIDQRFIYKIGNHPINCMIADNYLKQEEKNMAVEYYNKVLDIEPSYHLQLTKSIYNLVEHQKHWRLGAYLAKISLIHPCDTIILKHKNKIPNKKHNLFFKKIIKEENLNCSKSATEN